MTDRRCILDIYADILRVISIGGNKTDIVYKANLNFQRCKEYMVGLVDGGLVITKNNSTHPWAITAKGSDYLINYKALREILPLDGQVQKGVTT